MKIRLSLLRDLARQRTSLSWVTVSQYDTTGSDF